MATNTTKTSASNTSGTTPNKKTGKRRMKKQVRRTLGGLFLASAIAVAAIPVEPTQAVNTGAIDLEDAIIEHTSTRDDNASMNTNYVRAVHYVDATNSSFEKIPMATPVEADSSWQSMVPYIKETKWNATDPTKKDVVGDTIYVDEDMNFQFAFVKESATATDYFAVLVGVTNSAISSTGGLTIPDSVDAYLQYTASSTRGGYCAVNRKGDFLYYHKNAQVSHLTDGLKYKCVYHTQDPATVDTSKTSMTAGEIAATDIMMGPETTNENIWSNTTAGFMPEFTTEMYNDAGYSDPTLAIGNPTFRVSYSVFEYDPSTGTGDPLTYTGVWVNKYAYFPVSPIMKNTFLPCYLSTKSDWCPGGVDEDLYYWNSTSNDKFNVNLEGEIITASDAATKDGFIPVAGTDAMVQRLHNATVRYIGMQRVVSHTYDLKNAANEPVPITEWTVTPPTTVTTGSTLTETPSNGVFYGNANLRNLTIGPNMAGIGDYAFYRCTALDSVSFSNQLNTIGNGAFKGCSNLTNVELDPWTNLTIIGASAFEGCALLNSFDVPVAVTAIGDRAFKDCATSTGGIRNIYMCGEHSDKPGVTMSLLTVGYNAFENDEYLDYLEFPAKLAQKMPVHYLAGCTRLRYIKSNNPIFDVIDGDQILDGEDGATDHPYGSHTWDQDDEDDYFHHDGTSGGQTIKYCDIDVWLDQMESNDFYFESMSSYSLHKTAKDHSAAFNYDDAGKEDWFEIVKRCDETANNGPHEATFIVDTNDNLVSVELDPQCSVITIPDSIGGHGVSNIAQGSFSGNCSLKKLYIPYSVNSIEAGAFQGCHNLNTVFFTEPYNYNLTIGDGAFDTQVVSSHADSCNKQMAKDPVLNFVGDIDGMYAPFAYAMNGSNNFNDLSQTKSYITYYSGWPTFLQVEYNPDRADTLDENELVAYPTKSYLNAIIDAWKTAGTDAAKRNAVMERYPFMSAEQLDKMTKVQAYWADPDANPLSQEQQICADSIYDLIVPYGVESIKEGLFSNLDSDGNLSEFSKTQKYKIGDLCAKDGTVYRFVNDHDPGDWEASDVLAVTSGAGFNNLGGNTVLRSISLESIKTIDPYTFAGLTSLESLDITGNNEIGDYAFYGDKTLENVTISGDTTTIGIRPFRDCSVLTDIDFNGNNFTCEDAIIYGLTDGAKTSVVECLETRGRGTSNTVVSSKELAGITSMQEEAFMNCDAVETINLTDSNLAIVPERAFAATDGLYLVELPAGLKTIKKDAFLDSNIRQVSIPGMNTNIQDERVFSQTVEAKTGTTEFFQGNQTLDHGKKTDVAGDKVEADKYNPYVDEADREGKVTFNTPSGSFAEQYADDHDYIKATPAAVKYKVTFKDPENEGDAQILEVQDVASGECAQIPRGWNPNAHSGKTFLGWESSANDNVYSDTEVPTVPITETTTYKARYSGGSCTVTFIDKDSNVITTKEVTYGNDVSAPEAPKVDGYTFKGWDRYPVSTLGLTNITEDTTFKATYEKVDSSDKHHVLFYNYDDSIVSEQYIADGEAAQTPANPVRAGYTFTGWKPADFTNVTKDMDIYAQFEKNASGGGGGSSSGNSSGGSGGSGGSSGKSSSGNSSSGNSSKAKTYTVTVINGSGSGTYEEGSTVVIAANTPATGKAFDKWTTADVTLVSTTLSATSFKMPGKNVTVTANYKDDKSANSNTVKYATGNSGRPPATGRTATGTTQVQVNKGGVSNIDLARATVRGSTDSFIVKVTETNEATNLVENALNNRFGGLDALKYWPCDISLYDSTGNTKITDTTGLTVDITLPIPDELRQYGGNNKVAAVSNGQLEELSTKFNTVNGTPTVTFTATHFSPYVIYADTNNLVASEMLDASPKTGDPIHPKWFLAIALAAGSVFMFLKKDKKPVAVPT